MTRFSVSSSTTPSPTSTIRTVDSGYAVSITGKTPKTAPLSFASPQRSPIALFPDITLRGSPKSPREDGKRIRAASCGSALHHRHRSPPRSPHETKLAYDNAISRAMTDTAGVTDEIIARQTEILNRKHDIAIWQRKIHAAEKLIATMQDQVDCLVKTARDKQSTEKELAAERDAILVLDRLTEKEYNALGHCLESLDLKKI